MKKGMLSGPFFQRSRRSMMWKPLPPSPQAPFGLFSVAMEGTVRGAPVAGQQITETQ